MSDLYFKKFYDDIKDPSWPAAENYVNFLKLPEYIRNECINVHNMPQRLDQIESPAHWQTVLTKTLYYKNLAYVPVAKCASTYYIEFFQQCGWKEANISELKPGTICFGIFDEPVTRYLKGITEWIYAQLMPIYNYELGCIPTTLLDTVFIGDLHSLPYTTTLGPWLKQINCIPMYQKTDNQIKQHLMDLFASQKHDIKIPLTTYRANQSDSTKLELYNLVKNLFENPRLLPSNNGYIGRAAALYILLSSDLQFYRNLINTFDPTWQQIKNKI